MTSTARLHHEGKSVPLAAWPLTHAVLLDGICDLLGTEARRHCEAVLTRLAAGPCAYRLDAHVDAVGHGVTRGNAQRYLVQLKDVKVVVERAGTREWMPVVACWGDESEKGPVGWTLTAMELSLNPCLEWQR